MNKEIKATTWTLIKDQLRYVDCPHCGKTIIMSSPSVIEKLIKWAKDKFNIEINE